MLKTKLRRRIKDARVLALLNQIIDTSPDTEQAPIYFAGDDLLTPLERRHGIPIGNLTSQFFANLYFGAELDRSRATRGHPGLASGHTVERTI